LDQVEIIEPAVEICKVFQKNGFKLVVVTNQSGVARGLFDEKFVCETHAFLQKKFRQLGIFFDHFYHCPHHPNGIIEKYSCVCECRKPRPGMLLKASEDLSIDLSSSVMIGDKELDFSAGQAAGCKSFNINKLINLPHNEILKIVENLC
jgi:D-glycero-D-manno-heptose 1,7-bisphosphate phosphatase